MAGVESDASLGAGPGCRCDVTLSFAREQRNYAKRVAQALQARGMHCLYDAGEQTELWGKYLAEELRPFTASRQGRWWWWWCSCPPSSRPGTGPGSSARSWERREYVLPARFDDTPRPRLLSDMVALDLRGPMPEQFAGVVTAKLAALGVAALASASSTESPAS